MFIKIYILFLCMNVGLTVVDSFTWFDQTVPITTATNPKIANYTTPTDRTYALANATYPINQTSNTLFHWFNESTERIFFYPEIAFKFITGQFMTTVVSNAATSFGFSWPTGWITGLNVLFGITQFLWVGYIITGRSTSSFTFFPYLLPAFMILKLASEQGVEIF